jgi:hypothetical protein
MKIRKSKSRGVYRISIEFDKTNNIRLTLDIDIGVWSIFPKIDIMRYNGDDGKVVWVDIAWLCFSAGVVWQSGIDCMELSNN